MKSLKIQAKIYATKPGKTAMKAFASVDIGGLFYINSYNITTTTEKPDKLAAFPPSRWSPTGYKTYIEFPHLQNNQLVVAIHKACVSAYKKYEDTGRLGEYGEAFDVEVDKILNSCDRELANTANVVVDSIDNFDITKELEKLDL